MPNPAPGASQPTPHRTPLRRVSQGSLFALSRSGQYPDAPHGLGFLEPAMSELADEAEALHANVEGLKRLSDSLATFNESFASWLYVMKMNALTTDWPQAPIDASYDLAARRAAQRAERDAMAAMEAMQAELASQVPEPIDDKANMTEMGEGETTFITASVASKAQASSTTAGAKKKIAKPKLTAKEVKERGIEIERIISSLPLEFRGSDPTLRRNMEGVMEGLLDAPGRCAKLTDLIKPPDLSQARVNKCLIALVNRKVVKKESSTGTALYHWRGLP